MKTYFKSGDWNTVCDRCGFKFKAEDLVKEWTGLMVCKADHELRHPSDFLRVPKEDTSVPWSRPSPTEVFATGDYPITTEDGETYWITTEDGVILQTES
jgi:hypothetical protein